MVDWSRGQEGRFGQATAEGKQEQSKADAGSPSSWDVTTVERSGQGSAEYGAGGVSCGDPPGTSGAFVFPTAERFRSSRDSEVSSAANAPVGPRLFFVISSNLTTINTSTIGSVLTLHRHFHLSPLDPLARKREGSAAGATCSVAQSKRGWSISPRLETGTDWKRGRVIDSSLCLG